MTNQTEVIVRAQRLTPEAFAPYGKVVLRPTTPAPKTGSDWDCWFGVGLLPGSNLQLGQVITRPTDYRVTTMEREPTEEFLLPITGPVVQTVARPGNLSDPTEEPDASMVVAFRIEPGEAIIMSPGTWHWAAMPVHGETFYYFATVPHPPEPGRDPTSPWVPFRDRAIVRVEL